MASLSASSHIVGASYLSIGGGLTRKPAAEVMETFYSKLLPNAAENASTDFSKKVVEVDVGSLPSNLEEIECFTTGDGFIQPIRSEAPALSFAKHLPTWVPHVALTEKELESALSSGTLLEEKSLKTSSSLPFVKTAPIHAAPSPTQPNLKITSHLRFFVDTAATKKPMFEDKGTAPFDEQPNRVEGAISWMDFPVPKGQELAATKRLMQAFSMTTAEPIVMPSDMGKYVTVLNNTRKLENRHKLAGILPANLILPLWASDFPQDVTSLCFFSCTSREQVDELGGKVIAELGGKVPGPLIDADGRVCIAMDPNGAHFALYFRNDPWDEMKGSTKPPPENMFDGVELL